VRAFKDSVFIEFQRFSAFRADLDAMPALIKGQAFGWIRTELRLKGDRLWIAAPEATHRAACEKDRRPDARPVVDRIFLYIADEGAGSSGRIVMEHDVTSLCLKIRYNHPGTSCHPSLGGELWTRS
jgi:hypothetical protein